MFVAMYVLSSMTTMSDIWKDPTVMFISSVMMCFLMKKYFRAILGIFTLKIRNLFRDLVISLQQRALDWKPCAVKTDTEVPGTKKKRARLDGSDGSVTELEKNLSVDSGIESSSDTHEQVLPEVPDPPKKSTRRQRKRRSPNKSKFKSMMDDSSETSSTSDLSMKSDTAPEKTVIYTPLSVYVKLNLDMYALYHEFTHHLLTRDQLKLFGFPEEAPGRPGRAVMRTQNLTKGSTERRCCRCGSAFTILPNGQYVSDSFCRYHSKKQPPFRKGTPYHGDYPCCNGNYMSEGCMTWQYHVTAESALHDIEFVQTKSKKHLNEITAGTVYALDCEMVYTTVGMEVVKVGLVGVDGLTVFESFVLPQNQILDYNTAYSGVSEKDLKGVSMTLQDVQSYMLKLLNKESILVGHGLENDLKALRLIHYNIVDTSVAFPHKHSKYHKKSLKSIAQEILHKDIQMSSKGHNCIEDARTCMELMLHKIHSDLESKKYVVEDENKNSILQNIILPADLSTTKYTEYQPAWSYSCNFACYSNSRYASDYLMPKNYNNCIYG